MFRFKNFIALLIASGGFVGFLPWCPGTLGSLWGAFIFWFIRKETLFIQIGLVILVISLGVLVSHMVSKMTNQKDPEFVVIDEVAGMWFSVLGKSSFLEYLLAFIIFRVIDILKPFPLRKIERLKGGIGIMTDDVLAGMITNLLVGLIFAIVK